MKTAKIFAFLAMFLFPLWVFGVCPTQQTTVFYVNGVDVKEGDAEKSKERLKAELLKDTRITEECVKFDYVYNTNEPLFLDWLEAYFQKAGEATEFWKNYFRVDPEHRIVETVFNGTIDALAAVMQSMVNADQWVLGDQKAEHLARYKREINAKGRRVILVPHSQGNLYANEEYATLSENERTDMRIVATSTPSSFVPGDGPYTSVKEDKLASTIFAFTGALPTNLLNGTTQCSGSLADVNRWTCHGFKEEYLADGKPSRAKIVQDIILALPTAPTGLVTIVSNGSDFVLERNRNAVLVPYVHSAWTATEYIAGASWIWTTASPDPISDETATFQKKFEWNGTITKASLQIAADNSYSVSLNGILVAEDQSEGNYSASTWDEYDIAFAVQNGENVLRITVHNRGIGGEDNPAGLLYRVEVK